MAHSRKLAVCILCVAHLAVCCSDGEDISEANLSVSRYEVRRGDIVEVMAEPGVVVGVSYLFVGADGRPTHHLLLDPPRTEKINGPVSNTTMGRILDQADAIMIPVDASLGPASICVPARRDCALVEVID